MFTPQQVLLSISLFQSHQTLLPFKRVQSEGEMFIGDNLDTDQLSVCCWGPWQYPTIKHPLHQEYAFIFTAQVHSTHQSVPPTFLFPRELAKSSMTGTKTHLYHKQLSIYEAIIWHTDLMGQQGTCKTVHKTDEVQYICTVSWSKQVINILHSSV